MKKILAVLFILLFTAGDAFATIEVRYNNAGVRHSVTYGAHAPRSAVRFGTNAAFTPANAHYAGTRNREIQRQRAVTRAIDAYGRSYARPRNAQYYGGYNSIASTVNEAPISRYSKNYTVKAQRSYTRNGVTYYN